MLIKLKGGQHDTQMDEEEENALEENIEAQNEIQEEYVEDNSPTYIEKEDLYSLFWKIINLKDNSKVGNLEKEELGMLNMSVRDCLHIAKVAKMLGHIKFAEWLEDQAQIILRTSASKRGWFTELFVTTKKYSSREKKIGQPIETRVKKKKPFWVRR